MKNEKMKHADTFRTVSTCSETGRETLYAARMGHPVGWVLILAF